MSVGVVVLIVLVALLLGGVGLAVEALRWLLIIALVLLNARVASQRARAQDNEELAQSSERVSGACCAASCLLPSWSPWRSLPPCS